MMCFLMKLIGFVGANEPFDYVSVTPPYEEVNYVELLGQLSSSSILGRDTFVVCQMRYKHNISKTCTCFDLSLYVFLSHRFLWDLN